MATLTLSTTVEDLLRLAWRAERSGRPNLRDALMTLAVAESGPEEAVLAERCRRLLIARQPDHWYATTATLGQALGHEKVAAVIERLRAMFPPIRVQRQLLRASAEAGPFDGRVVPIREVFVDLGLVPARRRPTPAGSSASILRFPGPVGEGDDSPERRRELGAFYMTLLFSMAVLIQSLEEPGTGDRSQDIKAA